MRLTGRTPSIAWVEGVVDRDADHVSVSYGEDTRAVALVAQRANKGFTVQFLLRARLADAQASRILQEVRKELTFYLLDVVGPDSWPFVQYHCGTPANRRSIVHWTWHPKSAAHRQVSSQGRP
jgi:hypothetical protein